MSLNATVNFFVLAIHAQRFEAILAADEENPGFFYASPTIDGEKSCYEFNDINDTDLPFEQELQDAKIPYDFFWRDREAGEQGNEYHRIDAEGNSVFRSIDPKGVTSVYLSEVKEALVEGRLEQFIAEQEAANDMSTVPTLESQLENPHVPK